VVYSVSVRLIRSRIRALLPFESVSRSNCNGRIAFIRDDQRWPIDRRRTEQRLSMARPWSYWTRNKLEMLTGYLPAFNRASQPSAERVYIDLMAGQPENVDRDTGQRFDVPH
jgi:hypothetical protein